MENKPKENNVYAMLLEVRDALFLSVQYASSLEEAFNQAKLEFHRLNPQPSGFDNSMLGMKIGLFSFKTFNQMISENKNYHERKLKRISLKKEKIVEKVEPRKDVEIKKVEFSQEEVKNMIMAEIIAKKDRKLLREYKELLTENDLKYIENEIKKKKGSSALDK